MAIPFIAPWSSVITQAAGAPDFDSRATGVIISHTERARPEASFLRQEEQEDYTCIICFEKPSIFGLLGMITFYTSLHTL